MRLVQPSQVSGEIMDLLDKARHQVVIVSPYNKIKNWQKLAPYLQRLLARGIPVEYYVRKEKTPSSGLLEVYEAGFTPLEIEGLHCKFYLNEDRGIVTSMNLLLSSDVAALEIGYVTETAQEYAELVRFLNDNIRSRVVTAARDAVLPPPIASTPTHPKAELPAVEVLAETAPRVETLPEVLPVAAAPAAQGPESVLDCFSRLLDIPLDPARAHQLRAALSEELSILVEVRHFYVLVAYSFPHPIRQKLYRALYAQRAELEAQVGYPLSWGRDLLRVKLELSVPVVPQGTGWDQDKHLPVTDWSPLERAQLAQQTRHATQVLQQVVATHAPALRHPVSRPSMSEW